MSLKEINLEALTSRRDFLKLAGGAILFSFLPHFESFGQEARPEYQEAWIKLKDDLAKEVARYKNHFVPTSEISISVLDLQKDQLLSLDGDFPRQPGCVINQFVLYSLVEDFKKGLYPYEPLVNSIYLAVGESKANEAKKLLTKVGGGSIAAGVERVNQLIISLNLKTSFMDHPPAFGNEYSAQGRSNLMTTNEAVQVMSKLYRNEVFGDQKWTDFAIQKLIEGKRGLNYMIGLGLRDIPEVRVAHKIGYFWSSADKWVNNDAGLVLIDGGDKEIAYAMAIFAKGDPEEFSIVYDGWFTWRVSNLVYNFFKEQYLG